MGARRSALVVHVCVCTGEKVIRLKLPRFRGLKLTTVWSTRDYRVERICVSKIRLMSVKALGLLSACLNLECLPGNCVCKLY